MQDQNAKTDQNKTEPAVHPFQRTLGLGPYRFVGVFELGKAIAALNSGNVSGHNNMMANAPRLKSGMGTCSHCGHAIVFICIIKTANGELYGVGSDCVEKAGLPYAELTKLQKIEREGARLQRIERKAKKGNAARETLESLILEHGEAMALKPHPKGRFNDSLLDYAKWTLERSSDGGIVFALKLIQNEVSK